MKKIHLAILAGLVGSGVLQGAVPPPIQRNEFTTNTTGVLDNLYAIQAYLTNVTFVGPATFSGGITTPSLTTTNIVKVHQLLSGDGTNFVINLSAGSTWYINSPTGAVHLTASNYSAGYVASVKIYGDASGTSVSADSNFLEPDDVVWPITVTNALFTLEVGETAATNKTWVAIKRFK